MNIIKTAIKRGVFTAMIFLCIALLGIMSITKIGVDLFPRITMPMAVVMTTYSNAAPGDVEETVTKPLESALLAVQGVDSIQSTSSLGSSMVLVSFDYSTDMDYATMAMREKIDLVKGFFPEEVDNPMVIKMDPSMIPVLYVGISGGDDLAEMKTILEETIKPRLERQAGVASIDIMGGQTEEVYVTVDPSAMAAYGLSISAVQSALAANNINMSGGSISDNNKEVSVRVIGEYTTLDDIKNTLITTPRGSTIYVKDIATVETVLVDASSYVYMNGKPGVYMTITKQSDANTVDTVNAVTKELAKLQEDLPDNLEVVSLFDQGEMITMVVDNLKQSVILAVLLTMLIVFLFMRNIRGTVIIGASIPVALLFTFMMMFFQDMTLNMMTLGGLVLGVGMMVDSSIVILENIMRLRATGMSSDDAALYGTKELVLAVVASTLTTIAVFLPITFVEGIASMVFTDLALTITFALTASLIVAILLVPMLSSRLLANRNSIIFDDSRANKGLFNRVKNFYVKCLDWALSHRKTCIVSVAIVFLVSVGLVGVVGMEFLPSMDSGQIDITITHEDGTDLKTSNETARQVEERILGISDSIESVATLVGNGSSNVSMIQLQMVDKSKRDESNVELAEKIRRSLSDIPGVEIAVSAADAMSMSMSGGSVSIEIRGDDLTILSEIADDVKAMMAQVPGTREITSSLDEGTPELQVSINYNRASQYGVSVPQIASLIRSQYDGAVATDYTPVGGTETDIRVILPENYRTNIQNMLDIKISSPSGAQVALRDLVTVTEAKAPMSIERQDQTRSITVSCDIIDRDLGSVMSDVQAGLDNIVLPQGYEFVDSGDYEEMINSFIDLFMAMLLGIALVYMIMASLFESLLQPFIIIFTIPTTFIGVFLGLFLTGNPLSITSFMGMIMLMGIVVNNGIVLVDCVNDLREHTNMSCREALLTAGARRLRPILMTTLTTVLAMVPMILSKGEGSEMTQGMGVAVACGLTSSTMFTLIFIPVIYSLLDGKIQKSRARKEARKLSVQQTEQQMTANIKGGDPNEA